MRTTIDKLIILFLLLIAFYATVNLISGHKNFRSGLNGYILELAKTRNI